MWKTLIDLVKTYVEFLKTKYLYTSPNQIDSDDYWKIKLRQSIEDEALEEAQMAMTSIPLVNQVGLGPIGGISQGSTYGIGNITSSMGSTISNQYIEPKFKVHDLIVDADEITLNYNLDKTRKILELMTPKKLEAMADHLDEVKAILMQILIKKA